MNIRPEDMVDGVKQAQLNVVWQVIRAGLMANINLKSYPGLKILLQEGETVGEFCLIVSFWRHFAEKIDNLFLVCC